MEVARPTGAARRAGAGNTGAGRPGAKPNRRGVKSRELVLDAAERVMAEHGYEAATVARVVVEEAASR
jgi:AcrR family transcriptional regulator